MIGFVLDMGLFGDSPSGRVGELIKNANHDSVTEKRLTEVEATGLIGRGFKLNEKPVIDYLNEDEQPHHMLFNGVGGRSTEVSSEEGSTSFSIGGSSVYCLTDDRMLVVIGKEEEDVSISIPYDLIEEFNCKTARMKHKISVTTGSDAVIEELKKASDEVAEISGKCNIDFYITNAFDSEDIDAAELFLQNTLTEGETSGGKDESTGSEHYGKVKDYLDNDEVPQFILRGKTLEVEYSGGDEDKWGKNVYTVVSNKRILLVISQRISGNDTRSIAYDSIDEVNFEKGLINKKLQIRSGATYNVHILDQPKAKAAMEFIREKRNESQQETQVVEASSEPDPTEQLKNIKELHEQGVLSDEEFEEKKEKLMDQI